MGDFILQLYVIVCGSQTTTLDINSQEPELYDVRA